MHELYLSTIDPNAHQLAARYGLGLELAEFCTPWNLDDAFAETDRIVREKLTCADRFVLHAPFSELFPCAIDPLVREVAARRFRQTLHIAREHGIDRIVVHAGFDPHAYYPVWFIEQSVRFWQAFLPHVPSGTVLYLENVLEPEPSLLIEVLRRVDSPKLRMCLDVGHVNAYSAAPAAQWIEQCAPWLGHVHLHNNDTSRDSHSALMCGTLDIPQLLQAIHAHCPHATITLELPDAADSLQWLLEKRLI